jgi:hypothetical protein
MGAEVEDEVATVDTLAEGSADVGRCLVRTGRRVALEHRRR